MFDGPTKRLNLGQLTINALKAMRDRDMRKIVIVYTVDQGT